MHFVSSVQPAVAFSLPLLVYFDLAQDQLARHQLAWYQLRLRVRKMLHRRKRGLGQV